MIRFAYFGKNTDALLIVDDNNKKYSYWTNIKIDENTPVIEMKTDNDLCNLLNELLDCGYTDD